MPPPKQPNQLLKYGNLGFQMAVIIGLSAWGGNKLDAHYKNDPPVFTIILSLLGIAVALYIVIRDVLKSNK